MKQSTRAKRMERSHKRKGQVAALNLTSLMDIFTILVFFLMVNSGDVQVLKDTKEIKMPVSMATQKPKETLVVQISEKTIVVAGKTVANIADVHNSKEDIIPGLAEELAYQASHAPEMTKQEQQYGRALTVQGDHSVEYEILKKVMATAAKEDYRDIALAVTQTQKVAGEE